MFFKYVRLLWLIFVMGANADGLAKAKEKPAFSIHFNVEKYKLHNGLTVLLHVDRKAPLVNYQTWFRVGSKDDPSKETGMAHLFEHLMFRGTHKREGKEFIKDIESRGITYNAYTSFDHTVYHFNLPTKELEFIAQLEAERMTDLALTQKNLKLEQEIVKEELLMRYKNKPQNIWVDLFATAFKKNHYRWTPIGYEKDIDRVTTKSCQKFYTTFYSPNNAVLVISGPIHTRKAKSVIQKYYGALPASVLPEIQYPIEPPQKKQRVKNLYRKVQAPSVTLAYQAPKAGNQNTYALDILGFVLGGGKSSRLHQLLVQDQSLAVTVNVSNFSLKQAGLFIASASLHPKTSVKKVSQLMLKEVKKIATQSVTEEELSRAKTNVVKSYIDSLKTAEGKADQIALHETLFDNYENLFDEINKYQKVQISDITSVAKAYLNRHQSIFIRLYPKK